MSLGWSEDGHRRDATKAALQMVTDLMDQSPVMGAIIVQWADLAAIAYALSEALPDEVADGKGRLVAEEVTT